MKFPESLSAWKFPGKISRRFGLMTFCGDGKLSGRNSPFGSLAVELNLLKADEGERISLLSLQGDFL